MLLGPRARSELRALGINFLALAGRRSSVLAFSCRASSRLVRFSDTASRNPRGKLNLKPQGGLQLLHTTYATMEKGLTLRKKGNRRSQQQQKPSAPKDISGPVHLQKPTASSSNTLAVPREKSKGGDDTSDFVKRRYSTRFNAPPDFLSGAPPIPGIPSLPARYADQLQRPGSRERPGTGGSQPIRIDLLALRDPALQADKCEGFLRIMWALLIDL